MAKAKGGPRGGGGGGGASAVTGSKVQSKDAANPKGSGKEFNNKENHAKVQQHSHKENNSHNSSGKSRSSHPRNNRDKQHKNEDESPKLEEAQTGDAAATSQNHAAVKKEHAKQQLQPTSEQLMLAQITENSKDDDPNQRQKIRQVMDITGKEEETVATALFDAGWDENRAIELLLEDGDHLTAWEETGKKGKKKQKQLTDDNNRDDDEVDVFGSIGQEPREKSRQRGPPRMRRGGSSQGGDKGGGGRNRDNMQFTNGDQSSKSGDQPPRRGGGRGGGGSRSFQGRGGRGRSSGGGGGGGGSERDGNSNNFGGFSGSIDTWNNPGQNDNGAGAGGGSSSGGAGGASGSGKGHRGSRGGQHGSKDAFDNAGNWGDDFPAADDWDNEEYTGSLADTKVFTASSGTGKPAAKGGPAQQQQQRGQQPPSKQPPPPGVGNRVYSSSSQSTTNGSLNVNEVSPTLTASTVTSASSAIGVNPASASSYSQSIDLSTLLQKPTTQSSIGPSSQQQALLQFTQQATDSLKAAVGIGQGPPPSVVNPSSVANTNKDLGSYPPYSANAGAPSVSSGQYQGSAFTSIKPQQQPVVSASKATPHPGQQTMAAQHRSRMPPPSKIPNSAVEMPGESFSKLDVQFGALDLQFGGNNSAANTSANSDSAAVSGFEFSSSAAGNSASDDKYMTGSDKTGKAGGNAPTSMDAYGNHHAHPPSAKEVNKSLSNALSTGKLGANSGAASGPSDSSGYNDSRKAAGGTSAPTGYPTTRGPPPSMDSMSGSKNDSSLGGYHGANNYNNYGSHQKSSYHQSSTSAGGSYSSQNQYGSGSTGPSGGSSGYGSGHPGSSAASGSTSGYASQSNYSSASTPSTASTNYKGSAPGTSNNYHGTSDGLNKGFDGSSSSLGGMVSVAGHHQSSSSTGQQAMSSNAAAVLGLTSTTNALSGKGTTASKVNVPNIPPGGVASMLPPQYMPAGLTALYGFQQPAAAAMYPAAYGNAAGLEDLAALQSRAAQAGLHTLQQTGYYDPQFAATSLAAAAAGGGNRGDASNLNSLSSGGSVAASTSSGGGGVSSTLGGGSGSMGGLSVNNSLSASAGSGSATTNDSNKSAFGNVMPAANDSTSSPIPGTGSNSSSQQSMHQNAAANSAAFANLAATNAFAAQQPPQAVVPPGYAYFYPHLAGYGAANTGVYPSGMAVHTAAGGTATTQFQKPAYGTRYYGSGYDTLGQQGTKDFSNSYSAGSGGPGKSSSGVSSGASGGAGGAPGHQYWGSSNMPSTQLWS